MQNETENGPATERELNPNRPSQRPGLAPPRDPGAGRISLSPQEAAVAVERLRELCRTSGEAVEPLDHAAKALRDSGYKQDLTHVLREAITWPDAHPHVGALWVRRLVSSNNWDRTYPSAMDELCRRGEIGHRAVIAFLEVVAAKGRVELVRRTVQKHGPWLRENPTGWRVAAQALVQVRLYGLASRWTSDWRAHPDLNPGALYCVALALRGVGREREAHEVVQLALSKPFADQQFPILKLWCAQEEALAGNTESAAAHFNAINSSGWEGDTLALFYMTRGVIRVQRAEGDKRGEAFAAAADRIRDQFRRHRIHERELMLRRQYRRCLSRMAKDAGHSGAAFLLAWRSADQWSTLLPLLIVPGLQFFAPLYLFRLCRNRRGPKE